MGSLHCQSVCLPLLLSLSLPLHFSVCASLLSVKAPIPCHSLPFSSLLYCSFGLFLPWSLSLCLPWVCISLCVATPLLSSLFPPLQASRPFDPSLPLLSCSPVSSLLTLTQSPSVPPFPQAPSSLLLSLPPPSSLASLFPFCSFPPSSPPGSRTRQAHPPRTTPLSRAAKARLTGQLRPGPCPHAQKGTAQSP